MCVPQNNSERLIFSMNKKILSSEIIKMGQAKKNQSQTAIKTVCLPQCGVKWKHFHTKETKEEAMNLPRPRCSNKMRKTALFTRTCNMGIDWLRAPLSVCANSCNLAIFWVGRKGYKLQAKGSNSGARESHSIILRPLFLLRNAEHFFIFLCNFQVLFLNIPQNSTSLISSSKKTKC